MPKITNKQARAFVQNLKPFATSRRTLYAEWQTPTLYAVFSYGPHWPLFIYDVEDGTWFENEDKYGVTTTQHRNHTHPRTKTELRSTNYLRTLIAMRASDKCNDLYTGE